MLLPTNRQIIENEKEGDLFPTEPTDEDRQVEETLNPGLKELLGLRIKTEQVI